jgi:hypothetical protein
VAGSCGHDNEATKFHKALGNSLGTEQLLALQEGLVSMELSSCTFSDKIEKYVN